MGRIVDISDAKAQLSHLIEQVLTGEEVIISREGEPVAVLGPCDPDQRPRELGGWADRVWIEDDFEEPLPPSDVMTDADPHDVRLAEELLALDPSERLAALARAAALRARVDPPT